MTSKPQARQLVLFLGKKGENVGTEGVRRSALQQQSDLQLVKLPHPKGGVPVMFLRGGDDAVYELQNAAPRKHASWFINQRVCSDPSFYMASRIDPRFLILPDLEKASARFSPLDQIVSVAEGCARINLEKASSWGLHELCDINDKFGDDMILYRHNEAKMLDWLRAKVSRTARVFAKQSRRSESASNTLFVSSFNVAAQSAQSAAAASSSASALGGGDVDAAAVSPEDTRLALQIVCDYLADATAAKLLESFGMKATDLAPTKAQEKTLKRKADWEQELELEKETLAYNMKPTTAVVSSQASSSSGGASSSSSSSSAAAAAKKKLPAGKVKPAEGKASIASFFGKPKK